MLRRKNVSKTKAAPLIFIFGILINLVWIFGLYEINRIPDIFALKFVNPQYTAFMTRYRLRHPFEKIEKEWADYDDISDYLKRAVLTAEDDLFFEHNGYDWRAMKRALKYDIKKGSFKRGASTITQQLARNLYLTHSKNPIRKLHELALAVIMEKILSKERIFEIYLNVVEWGPGVFGAEAAARHYFNIPADKLSPKQAAFLASILPSPVKLGKRGFRLNKRGMIIFKTM